MQLLLQICSLFLQVSDALLHLLQLLLQLLFVPLVLMQALCRQNWAVVKPVAQLLPHWLLTLQTQNGSTATAASTASKASYTI